MKPGSVIVDLAVEQGGNCPLTERDQVVVKHGVKIVGSVQPAGARWPPTPARCTRATCSTSSTCWSTPRPGELKLNRADEIIAGTLVCIDGAVVNEELTVHGAAVDPLVINLTVFVLAVFVGYHVVWNVTPALHTPLMSVTNAISSVIIVGAILAAGPGDIDFGSILGAVAVALVAINTFGGFLVTQRMLEMFKKKEPKEKRRDAVRQPGRAARISSPASSSSWP